MLLPRIMKFHRWHLQIILVQKKKCKKLYICGYILKNKSLKKGVKFGIKIGSSSEVSNARALAKLSLNFRKSSRP